MHMIWRIEAVKFAFMPEHVQRCIVMQIYTCGVTMQTQIVKN